MARNGTGRRSDSEAAVEAVLITEARTSVEEQHRARVRKYLLIMSVRLPALILAALAYTVWENPWISMGIIAISIPLPWMAVLIANDRPPRTADEPSRYGWSAVDSSALETRSHPVVDLDDDSGEGSEPGRQDKFAYDPTTGHPLPQRST